MSWFRRSPTLFSQSDAAIAVADVSEREGSFSFFGGRRHLRDMPYALPKDDQEVNRLDFQHYMLRYALRGNYAAPITQPTSILDVGCGTGRWAMEMATHFAGTSVYGVDIVASAMASMGNSGVHALPRQANYQFVQGNVLEGLPFPDASFDFVHMRLLSAAIPAHRWSYVIGELVRMTRPGGWVEVVESGGVLRDGGPAVSQLIQMGKDACARRGINLEIAALVGDFLRDAGLRNVTAREVPLPVGRWGGRVGAMAATDVFALMEGVRPLVVSQGITTQEQHEHLTAVARTQIHRHRCVFPFYVAFGQR